MKWKFKSVECVLHAIPESEYQQKLAELAEYLAQIPKGVSPVPKNRFEQIDKWLE